MRSSHFPFYFILETKKLEGEWLIVLRDQDSKPFTVDIYPGGVQPLEEIQTPYTTSQGWYKFHFFNENIRQGIFMILRMRTSRYLQVRLCAMVNDGKFARDYNSTRERMNNSTFEKFNNRTNDSTNFRCFVDAVGIKPRGTVIFFVSIATNTICIKIRDHLRIMSKIRPILKFHWLRITSFLF